MSLLTQFTQNYSYHETKTNGYHTCCLVIIHNKVSASSVVPSKMQIFDRWVFYTQCIVYMHRYASNYSYYGRIILTVIGKNQENAGIIGQNTVVWK